MATLCSVRKSILLDVRKEIETNFTINRNTYEFINDETIRINSVRDNAKTKVKSRKDPYAQAKQIANWLVQNINKLYNKHVIAYMDAPSKHDPVEIRLSVNQAYIEHLYNNLPLERQQDPDFVRDKNYFNGDEYLLAQEQKEFASFNKTFNNLLVEESLDALISNLSEKTGVELELISSEQAKELLRTTPHTWNGEGAFFYKNKVYVVGKDNLTLENVLHEFSHPFVRAISKQNPKLFNNLYNLVPTELIEYVSKLYPELVEESEKGNIRPFMEECIVHALTAAAKNQYNVPKTFVEKFISALKALLRKIFPKAKSLASIDLNTNIEQLAKILLFENIDMNQKTIDVFTNPMFNKKMQEEISKIKPETINKTINDSFTVLKEHIKRISTNKNLSQLKVFFNEEEQKGEIFNLKEALKRADRAIELIDQDEAKVRNFSEALKSLEIFTSQFSQHAHDLASSKTLSPLEKINALRNYLYISNDWEGVLQPFMENLKKQVYKNAPELTQILSKIKSNIEDVKYFSNEFIEEDGLPQILSEDLLKNEFFNQARKNLEDYIAKLKQDKKQGRKKIGTKNIDEVIKEQELLLKKTTPTKENITAMIRGELGDSNFFSGMFESYTSNPNMIVGGFANFFMRQKNKLESLLQEKFQKFYNNISKTGVNKNDIRNTFSQITSKVIKGYINKETGELEKREFFTLKNQYQGNYQYIIDEFNYKLDDLLRKNNNVKNSEYYKLKKQRDAFLHDYMFTRETEKVQESREFWLQSPLHEKAKEVREIVLDDLKEAQQRNAVTPEEIESKQKDIDRAVRNLQQLTKLTDEFGNPKSEEELTIVEIIKEYQKQYGNLYERKEIKGAFDTALKDKQQELEDKYGKDSPEYKKELNNWIRQNVRISLSDAFYEDRQKLIDELDAILNKNKETQDLSISNVWKEIIDLTKSYRDQDNQPIGSDLTPESISKIKERQEKILNLRKKFREMMNMSQAEEEQFVNFSNMLSKGIMLNEEDNAIYKELKTRNDVISKNKLSKEELKKIYQIFEQLDTLQSRISTPYYVEKVNTFLETIAPDQMIDLSSNLEDIEEVEELFKPKDSDTEEQIEARKRFEKWFKENHVIQSVKEKQGEKYVNKDVYKRIYVWNRIIPNEKSTKSLIEKEDYIGLLTASSKYISVTPSMKYFYIDLKPEYKTKKIVGVTVDNRDNYLPKPTMESATEEQKKYMLENNISFAKDDKFVDKDYVRLKKEGGKYWNLLQEYTRFHLDNQKETPYYTRLWLEIPRDRKDRVQYNIDEAKSGLKSWFETSINIFKNNKDDYEQGRDNYKQEEEVTFDEDGVKTVVLTDIFGNQPTNIPIKYKHYVDPENVSMDIAGSLIKYATSIQTNKMQHEISPVAQALKDALSKPDNAIKEVDKLAKGFAGKMLNILPKEKGKVESNMYKSINNFIETYIEGIDKKFIGGGEAGKKFDRFANHLMQIGSLTLIAPTAAIKNLIAGNIQKHLESINQKIYTQSEIAKAEYEFDTRFIPNLVKDAYSINKSLESQLLQILDPQMDFSDKVASYSNASVKRDVVDLKFLLGGQKLGEIHIAGTTALTMLINQKVSFINTNGEKSEIRYLDAWELKDGVIQLKDGVDKSWDKTSDNFLNFKSKVQKVLELNQGAYAKENQADFQRYTVGKLAGFMRRYFIPMFMNRWASKRANYALGDYREGYYRTFLRMATELVLSMGKNWQYFSKEEKMNSLKVLAEISYSLMFMALISLLGWDDDDEEKYVKLKDNWVQSYILYQAMLIKSETESFIPIPGMGTDEILRLVSTPTVALNTFTKYYKLLKHTGLAIAQDEDAVYKKDTGLYNKGDYKYLADLYSIFGIRNMMIIRDPSEGIKMYQTLQRRY